MKHLNQVLAFGTLAIFLLAGRDVLGQSASKPAALKPKAQSQTTQPSDQDLNIRAYIELLRSDVKAQATAVIAEMMDFSDDEAAKFWPIYREFELELSKIGDRRVALIQKYADNFDSMSEDAADQLAQGAFSLEQDRHDLKKRYYDRVKQALTAKTAVRFLQVQTQVLNLIDLQIASALPVVK